MSNLDAFKNKPHIIDSNQKDFTFEQYFDLVLSKPHLNQTSAQRVYNMILSHGISADPDGKIEYNFFKNRIFGAEKQIEDIMNYLKAASLGLDIKKRVLLLLGPPGGGKSQILSLLKKGLAHYSTTDSGAVYAIKDCPIHENPLHLIAEDFRDELWKKYHLKIEGKLCPYCQEKMESDTSWNANIGNVGVERVYISEENRIGIGTFAPSEKNDMTELYGSPNISRVNYFGNEADSRAYAFNGELHTANRGIMEFIEVLKANPEFLHVLLTLAEEQQFKTPRFPLQYVDELLIAHTNESEFIRFINNPENEAVIDRLFIVKMPYNMLVENEEKIYHYALQTKLLVDNISVHPGAVRLASSFVIKTRDNKDTLRIGMSGLSPRFILNTLALSLVKTRTNIVKPFDFLLILKEQVEKHPILNSNTKDEYLSILNHFKENIYDFEQVQSIDYRFEKEDETEQSIFRQVFEDTSV